MSPEQVSELKKVRVRRKVLKVEKFDPKTIRTLLLGKCRENLTWHIYIANDFFIYVYRDDRPVNIEQVVKLRNKEINLEEEVIVPNLLLYSLACDFEFCKALKESGIYLPAFDDSAVTKTHLGYALYGLTF